MSGFRVDEISLVDKGANGKRFFLLKRFDNEVSDMANQAQEVNIAKVAGEFRALLGSNDPEAREQIEKADRNLFEYVALGEREGELTPEDIPMIEALIEKRAAGWLAAKREYDASYTPERTCSPAPSRGASSVSLCS
ncbi:MAG: hypothetical protein ACREXS_13335 [Gammaproteobacteria bacterium]